MQSRKPKTRDYKSIAVAVVEPEFPINVGYVARAMANFGISELYIVSMEFSKSQQKEAERFASHGGQILHRARKIDSLDKLRDRFRCLVGTTAIRGQRKSNLTRKTLDVSECAQRVTRLLDFKKPNQLCILLGRDTTGLTNQELQQCDFTATIDTGSGYNTMNLSHALAILLYVFMGEVNGSHPRKSSSDGPLGRKNTGSRKERDRVVHLFEQLAASSDFQKFKRGKLQETLFRLLSRGDPSLRELYLLMGLASKANAKIVRLETSSNSEKTN